MSWEDDLGKLFTTDGTDAWRLRTYCSQPTATFENLETKETCGGSIYSPNVRQFKALSCDPCVRPVAVTTKPGGE